MSEDNPELIEGKTSRALFKYYKKHGYTIAQKTDMIMQTLWKTAGIVTQCFLDNNDSFAKLFNDPEFYQKVQEAMAAELYTALRKDKE